MPASKTAKTRRAPQRPGEQASFRLGHERIARLLNHVMLISSRPPFVAVTATDVVKRAIDEYLVRHRGDEDLPAARPCALARVGSAAWCATCGENFRLDADAPTCPSDGKEVQLDR